MLRPRRFVIVVCIDQPRKSDDSGFDSYLAISPVLQPYIYIVTYPFASSEQGRILLWRTCANSRRKKRLARKGLRLSFVLLVLPWSRKNDLCSYCSHFMHEQIEGMTKPHKVHKYICILYCRILPVLLDLIFFLGCESQPLISARLSHVSTNFFYGGLSLNYYIATDCVPKRIRLKFPILCLGCPIIPTLLTRKNLHHAKRCRLILITEFWQGSGKDIRIRAVGRFV